MLLQQQGVLAHQTVAGDTQEDPDTGQGACVRKDLGKGLLKKGSGQPADEPKQADPDAEADKETATTHAAPREVKAPEEDEDASEIRREAEDDESDHGHDESGIVQSASLYDEPLIQGQDVSV